MCTHEETKRKEYNDNNNRVERGRSQGEGQLVNIHRAKEHKNVNESTTSLLIQDKRNKKKHRNKTGSYKSVSIATTE